MNDINRKRKIISVYGEEAKLVKMAEQADFTARQRAQASTPAGLINPITTYETPAEQALVWQVMELEKKYQMAFGLALPPILVAADTPLSQLPADSPSIKYFHRAPTDMEMAQLFLKRVTVRRVGQRIYRYNGRIYKLLTVDQFHTLIYDTLRQELSISGNSKQIRTVEEAIMAEPSIEVRQESINEVGICLRNGVLSLSDFNLYNHSPSFFNTWMLDVDWLGEQPCSSCDRFFEFAAGGDPVLIQRFWEAIAYALFPDNRAKRFIVLMGLGDTGKSVFGDMIASFFEEDAVGSVDIFRLGDRFSLSTLVNKRVNISMDLSDAALNMQAIGIIKQITGGDLVQVEEKYKPSYAAKIGCKLIFGTNHTLRANDVAFLRRVLYLPFNYPVPHHMQNPNLRQMLRSEKSGIFYRALNAYKSLVAKGYFFSGDNIYDFTKAYQAGEAAADMSTDLENFVATHCVEQADGFVTTKALFDSYQSYCQSINHDFIRNKQTFSAKFNNLVQSISGVTLGKRRVNGTACNGYSGLNLIE